MSAKSGGPEELEGAELGRRKFLERAGLAAGAVIATSIMPPSGVAAVFAPAAATTDSPQSPGTACGDDFRDVDDMWGHWPRYAHPIPHAGTSASPIDWEHVDPIDRMLVI